MTPPEPPTPAPAARAPGALPAGRRGRRLPWRGLPALPPRAALALLALLTLLPTVLLWAPASVAAQSGVPQGIGAYFSLLNTYVYENGPRDGRRILVRPRGAFTVLDAMADGQGATWFQIVFPAQTAKRSGVGWTPSAPHEVLSTQLEPVLVFSRIPGETLRDVTVLRVQASGVELLNESQTTGAFAQVVWQKVRYTVEQPLRVWARAASGLFRPGKSAAFLSRVYGELVTRSVEKDTLARLLSGVVHIGDDVRAVRWALGDPLRNQTEAVGEALRAVWQYAEMTITFENDVVKQIN